MSNEDALTHLIRGRKPLCHHLGRLDAGDTLRDHKEYQEGTDERWCRECQRIKRDLRRVPRVEKERRVIEVNEFIAVIAAHGRHFFRYKDVVARFELDDHGKIWFHNEYTGKRIYTHQRGGWKGFHHGGTLLDLCKALRDYIMGRGEFPARAAGPWPEWLCNGDLWGYEDDIKPVREKIREILEKRRQ